jgi:uncharacterized protein
MSEDLRNRISAFLDVHHVLSLATCGPHGPHGANLFYARDGLSLVWVSDGDAQHSREIAADPRVAATIAPDYADFALVRGLQITGLARRIEAQVERTRHYDQLEARYSFLRRSEQTAQLREAYGAASIYLLEPARIVFIDNTRGFGHKETLALSPSAL